MVTLDLPGMSAIDIFEVPFVDNEGQPCEGCQNVDNFVSCTVYGVLEGEEVTLDRCVECAPMDAIRMDPNHPVKVEIGLTGESDLEAYDDRMHGPDCTCVHPDGE
jgi:hypothetical protein